MSPSLTSYSNVYKPRPKSNAATTGSSLMAQFPCTIRRPGWSKTASTVMAVETMAVRMVVGLMTCAVDEMGRLEMMRTCDCWANVKFSMARCWLRGPPNSTKEQ